MKAPKMSNLTLGWCLFLFVLLTLPLYAEAEHDPTDDVITPEVGEWIYDKCTEDGGFGLKVTIEGVRYFLPVQCMIHPPVPVDSLGKPMTPRSVKPTQKFAL